MLNVIIQRYLQTKIVSRDAPYVELMQDIMMSLQQILSQQGSDYFLSEADYSRYWHPIISQLVPNRHAWRALPYCLKRQSWNPGFQPVLQPILRFEESLLKQFSDDEALEKIDEIDQVNRMTFIVRDASKKQFGASISKNRSYLLEKLDDFHSIFQNEPECHTPSVNREIRTLYNLMLKQKVSILNLKKHMKKLSLLMDL